MNDTRSVNVHCTLLCIGRYFVFLPSSFPAKTTHLLARLLIHRNFMGGKDLFDQATTAMFAPSVINFLLFSFEYWKLNHLIHCGHSTNSHPAYRLFRSAVGEIGVDVNECYNAVQSRIYSSTGQELGYIFLRIQISGCCWRYPYGIRVFKFNEAR